MNIFKYLNTAKSKETENKTQALEEPILKYLHPFIKENNIKLIVETGVYKGYSSSIFLDALPEDGMLISIEPNVRKDIIVPKELYKKWVLIKGFSEQVIPNLIKLGLNNVDLFWHDGRHVFENQRDEFNVFKNISTYIGSHDINHPGVKKDKTTAWKLFKNSIKHELLIEKSKWGLLKVL